MKDKTDRLFSMPNTWEAHPATPQKKSFEDQFKDCVLKFIRGKVIEANNVVIVWNKQDWFPRSIIASTHF